MRNARQMFAVLAMLVVSTSALAYDCDFQTMDEEFEQAMHVVRGRLLSLEAKKDSKDVYVATFDVRDVLKGFPPDQYVLTVGRLDYRYNPKSQLRPGFSYLMFMELGQTTIKWCDPVFMLGASPHWYQWYEEKRAATQRGNDT